MLKLTCNVLKRASNLIKIITNPPHDVTPYLYISVKSTEDGRKNWDNDEDRENKERD
jgi:hypothetical protein